jgi:hypothetical protein
MDGNKENHYMASPPQGPLVPAEEFIAKARGRFIGKLRRMKDIGREGEQHWRTEAVTFRQQSNYPYKVAFVERLRMEAVSGTRLRQSGAQIGDVEYRIGYYTVARNGHWWFGQFALLIPKADLRPLLQLARDEGTLLDDLEIHARAAPLG